MKRAVNTYQGLSSDLAYDSIGKGLYIDALDIRITTDTGQSQGAISNVKGNLRYFDLPTAATEATTWQPLTVNGTIEIIGATSIRNMIILFLTDDSDSNGWIYTVEYDEIDKSFLSLDFRYKNNELNFSKKHPIEAIGRFESDCIQRAYWTDYNNYFRSVNLLDPNLWTLPIGLIDGFPNIKYQQPLLKKVLTGGSLLAGTHQYAYRLITSDGKETLISPPSNLIHTTDDSEINRSPEYNGTNEGVNTNKAHEILINTSDYNDFENIELINIFHSNYTGITEVFSIEIKAISGLAEIVFIHSGDEESIIPLDLFEYTVKQYPFKTYKTATNFDNSLVIANIKNSEFDIQTLLGENESFESRTERYNSNSVLPFPLTGSPSEIDEKKLNNAFNVSTVNSTLSNPLDGYNMDAHWDASWHTDKQYKYKSNGTTLGGDGPNISYEFHLEPYIIDGSNGPGYANLYPGPYTSHDLNDGYGTYANTALDSLASPFYSGLMRGYKRGETYRFGIIFYNKKGESSFVEYIGDIKFPDISDENDNETIPGSNIKFFPISRQTITPNSNDRKTDAYAMGIKFNIDFSSCPILESKIESYQIVRVKRKINESRRLCTGIMKTFGKHDIESNRTNKSTDNGFNLKPNGDKENVLHLFPWTRHNDSSYILGGTSPDGPKTKAGCNGNFFTINDEYRSNPEIPNPYDPAKDATGEQKIMGSFLSMYSPDISYNFAETRNSITADSMLLITGRYRDFFSTTQTNGIDLKFGNSQTTYPGNDPVPNMNIYSDDKAWYGYSTKVTGPSGSDEERLGEIRDMRRTLRTVSQVDKESIAPGAGYNLPFQRGVEYVKQLKDFNIVDFTTNNKPNNSNEPIGFKLGPYQGFNESGNSDAPEPWHLRNFYIYLDNEYQGINDLETNNRGTNVSLPGVINYGNKAPASIAKGATGLTGSIKIPTIDPYTGIAITGLISAKNHFRSGRVLDLELPIENSNGATSIPENFVTSKLEKTLTNQPSNLINENYRNADLNSTPIMDILVPRLEVYGGYTPNALVANTFIVASPIISKENLNPTIFGGDIFITSFTFQEQAAWINQKYYDPGGLNGNSSNAFQQYRHNYSVTTAMFMESRVNVELAYGSTLKTGVEFTANGGPNGIIHEHWRQESDNSSTDFGKSSFMYFNTYNNVYSIENNDVVFFVKPLNLEIDCDINDTRAYLSNVKINSETVDSWTKFGIANFYDIDDYGPINKIINYKDNVYYFQDTAVGKYSINPRAVTSTDDGIPTELGSSKGFQDHTYISNKYGSIHQWAVVDSDTGIYYFDGIHNKIFKIGESNAPISEMKGNHSFLKNLKGDISLRKENDGDNPILRKGVHASRDLINNEIIFTFLGLKDNPLKADSLVFDEVANQFSSRYSAVPSIYVENKDIILSPDPLNPGVIYQNGTGQWGNFYNNVTETSIKLVLNDNSDINKVLRFIEFNSIVRDDNKLIDRFVTITAFKVTTEYQTTNKIDFSTGRIKRKFDKWRLKIPRDATGVMNTQRLRSTHFILTLYFDNTQNKELILNRIMYYYDEQSF